MRRMMVCMYTCVHVCVCACVWHVCGMCECMHVWKYAYARAQLHECTSMCVYVSWGRRNLFERKAHVYVVRAGGLSVMLGLYR